MVLLQIDVQRFAVIRFKGDTLRAVHVDRIAPGRAARRMKIEPRVALHMAMLKKVRGHPTGAHPPDPCGNFSPSRGGPAPEYIAVSEPHGETVFGGNPATSFASAATRTASRARRETVAACQSV